LEAEINILFDCDSCKRYPCIFIKQGEPKELKGECIGYDCDIDLVTKEIIKISENENN
jgi:hypothetical protein